ncbi:hypothetical protein [Parageobacillus toebii]|uniref:thiolase family protein n=1 Tax=Parageobacillus toebii TaxID=153151 RepID=UPI003F75A94F
MGVAYMKRDAVIVSAVRTAIARQGGALATVPAHIFGAEVIKEAMRRANIGTEMVDDVIMGNVLSGGGNIARLTALQTGLSLEINEAFAAQVIACDRELNMNPEKVNVNGGAIAHGHPLGATGAILITKAVYELQRSGGRYALITACIGGGQGIATIIERE